MMTGTPENCTVPNVSSNANIRKRLSISGVDKRDMFDSRSNCVSFEIKAKVDEVNLDGRDKADTVKSDARVNLDAEQPADITDEQNIKVQQQCHLDVSFEKNRSSILSIQAVGTPKRDVKLQCKSPRIVNKDEKVVNSAKIERKNAVKDKIKVFEAKKVSRIKVKISPNKMKLKMMSSRIKEKVDKLKAKEDTDEEVKKNVVKSKSLTTKLDLMKGTLK